MGKRCKDTECPYFAEDGTCLLPKYELKEKCPARERVGYEEMEDWISEDYVRQHSESLGHLAKKTQAHGKPCLGK